ncbi:hypothetical protein FO519_002231 [Halicephalobus sp. NKZ332]|nr:hypothetical protein FO519_002231 [Halicephalobus sp. NKZ332]
MSLAAASNGPEAKKFRFALPTQVVVNDFDFDKKNIKIEEGTDMESSSNGEGSENGLDLRSSEKLSPSTNNNFKREVLSPSPSLSQDSSETSSFGISTNPNFDFPLAMLFQHANSLMKSVSKDELKAAILAQSRGPAPTVPPAPPAPIPGALAVAASPAAQLFSEDDWSWHRNPAAAIRSGGTNKQTPVWKYFVYNKAENLSRCIIGDCTYMLKGPHTSTLACHLKKHPLEYAEFQKLKQKFQQEYTRERSSGQINGSSRTSQPSSTESSARHTPTSSTVGSMSNASGNFKKAETPTGSIFGNKNFPSGNQKLQNRTSSMADILNLLNARANANVSPQTKLEEQVSNVTNITNAPKNSDSPVTPIPPLLSFPALMGNQKTNPFLDFVEAAQPKFNMPLDVTQIDDLINSQFSRTIQSIKIQLAAAPKIALLLDLLKICPQKSQKEVDENTEILLNQNSKSPVVRICVSGAYYCSSSQTMEVVLLGIRPPSKAVSIDEGIKVTVDQIMSEFDITWERVSRVVTSGLSEVGASGNIFPKQLEPYNQKLTLSLINVFDTDEVVISLKKSFYSMVYRFAEIPEAVAQFIHEIEQHSTIPLGEPFFEIAEFVLKNKGAFLKTCRQEQFESSIPVLDEDQWTKLENIINLLSLFKTHMKVVQDGQYATIDRVVPSLMQLKVCLERDFKVLGELPEKLLKDLQNRAQYILDSSVEGFDGSFIQATALNPQLAVLLDDSQINYAKNAIEKILEDRMKQAEEFTNKKIKTSGGVDALLAAVVERKTSTVPCNQTSPANSPASSTTSEISSTPSTATALTSSTNTLTLYPDLLQAASQRRKVLHDRSQNGKSLFAEAMVQSYFDDLLKSEASSPNGSSSTSNIASIPPLQYWQMTSIKTPQLSDIAVELLTVPSCTVSLERIFNYEGVSQSAYSSLESQLLRALDTPGRMERDTILRFNRNFIPKTI